LHRVIFSCRNGEEALSVVGAVPALADELDRLALDRDSIADDLQRARQEIARLQVLALQHLRAEPDEMRKALRTIAEPPTKPTGR